MKTTLILAILLGQGLAAVPPARAAALKWEKTYNGAASSFDWAHHISLDPVAGVVYVSGKSSETYGAMSKTVTWANGFYADSGQPVWTVEKSTVNLGGLLPTGPLAQEEIGVSVEAWPGGNLLVAGRYSKAFGTKAWTGYQRLIRPDGSLLGTYVVNGLQRSSAFSPPVRGAAVALLDAGSGGWALNFRPTASVESSGQIALDYSFTRFSTGAVTNVHYEFPPYALDANWSGDCCYDPPARMAADAAGNVYSLAGSRYNETTGSYGFLVLKVTAFGGSSVWSYHGTAGGMNVADALVAGADGSVYVLAKTSEAGRGFGSRLLAFDVNGTLRWSRDLSWKGILFKDAALALSPKGTLWVVESATGRAVSMDSAGELLSRVELPFDAPAVYYVGQIVADAAGNLYAGGTKNGDAWLARFDPAGSGAARPSCILSNSLTYPNPFDSRSSHANLRYELYEDSNVKIAIFDLLGQPVKRFDFAAGQAGGAAGVNQVPWDGTSDNGKKVIQGLYLAHLSTRPSVCDAIVRIGVRH